MSQTTLFNDKNLKPIPGWGGQYLAHRSGSILSKKSNKVLSVHKSSDNHYRVSLKKNGQSKIKSPGRLVIKAFQDPVLPDDKWVPYRINGERDFRVCNLVPKPRGGSDKKPAYQKLYTNYRSKCEREGIRFTLSKADFADLCSEDCYYCGARPSRMKSVDGVANGIDRVYPNVGYVKSNCVPCCRECNRGKSDAAPSEFVERAIRIANRHSPNDIRIPRSSSDMSAYT